jgi:hypothetical protein
VIALPHRKQRERRGKLHCIVCLVLVTLPLLFESDGTGKCSAQPLQQRQWRVAAHAMCYVVLVFATDTARWLSMGLCGLKLPTPAAGRCSFACAFMCLLLV